jgi:hypothetical protein
MAVPAKQNLSMTRGDTETVVVTMKDSTGTAINITGRTYRAQIRTVKDAATIVDTIHKVILTVFINWLFIYPGPCISFY